MTHTPKHYIGGQWYSPEDSTQPRRRPLPPQLNEAGFVPFRPGTQRETALRLVRRLQTLDLMLDIAEIQLEANHPLVVQHFGLSNLDTKAG